MPDVLSQHEIDALLNALNTGEVSAEEMSAPEPTQRVRTYDFRTANRFSKEQIRTLSIIYDTFAHLLSNYLAGTLRAICNVEVIGIEELKYFEFINALPDPVVLTLLSMPPLVGPTLLEVSPDVSVSIVSRLLGGSGSTAGDKRSFTEIELVLIERIVRQFGRLLDEAWEKVIEVHTVYERMETSAQFAQIVSTGETVAIVSLNVTIGEYSGLINFCLPHLAIESISKQLNTKMLFQGNSEHVLQASASADIRSRIRNTRLPITAMFNETGAQVRDVIALQQGDVIQLDHKVGEPLVLKVGHLDKFRGALGVRDRRYAVKISKVIREEEEAYE